MSPELDEILKKAMSLPPDAREALATSLFESLDQTVEADVDPAWQQEISKRMKEIESGQVKTIRWEEVKKTGHSLLDGK
jgi:putative addiction module component (TIGR02574 family)